MNFFRSFTHFNTRILYGLLIVLITLATVSLYLAINANHNQAKNKATITKVQTKEVQVVQDTKQTKIQLALTTRLACEDASATKALLTLRSANPKEFKGITLPSQNETLALTKLLPNCSHNIHINPSTPAKTKVVPKTTSTKSISGNSNTTINTVKNPSKTTPVVSHTPSKTTPVKTPITGSPKTNTPTPISSPQPLVPPVTEVPAPTPANLVPPVIPPTIPPVVIVPPITVPPITIQPPTITIPPIILPPITLPPLPCVLKKICPTIPIKCLLC